MPIYIYQHPHTGEIREIFQNMNDEHVYYSQGVKWKRVFTTPQLASQGLSNIDPFSEKQFLDKTDKPTTIGDMIDRAKELSQKRADKNGGVDPLKEKFVKEYKEKYKRMHPSELKKID